MYYTLKLLNLATRYIIVENLKVFSGSAVVDVNNTSKFFPNRDNRVVAIFTLAVYNPNVRPPRRPTKRHYRATTTLTNTTKVGWDVVSAPYGHLTRSRRPPPLQLRR